MDDRLMTLDEVADYLGVSRRTLYNWRYLDTGPPGFKLGAGSGGVRYRRSEVDTWLESRRDRPAADVSA